MRSLLILTIAALLALAVACSDNDGEPSAAVTPVTPVASSTSQAPVTTLELTSSAFADNQAIPTKYTCDGDNVLPPLAIEGVPRGTVALAISVVDLDGPGGGFVHWTVWNIDRSTSDVAEGAVPAGGVEGQTGRGSPGFFGPCPPSGEHRYVFTLYALDARLVLDAATSGLTELQAAMEGHVLESTTLTGFYAR